MRLIILMVVAGLLFGGCGKLVAIEQQLMLERIEFITPDGCWYLPNKNRFACFDKEQQTYINSQEITDQELEQLGRISGNGAEAVPIFTRLHDCAIRPHNKTVVCRYKWSQPAIHELERQFIVTERHEDSRYIYTVVAK